MLLAIISSSFSGPFSLERQLPTVDFLRLSRRLLGLCYFSPQFTLSSLDSSYGYVFKLADLFFYTFSLKPSQ